MPKGVFIPVLLAAVIVQTGCARGASPPASQPVVKEPESFQPLSAPPGQGAVEGQIVQKLQSEHYNKVSLDDRFSKKLFRAYIDDLDSAHAVLLQSDIAALRGRYATVLDNQLEAGQTQALYAIFNTYQKRRLQIDRWALAQVQDGLESLDLSTDATLATDRSEAPWPVDQAARRALWRKRLKNEVIRLRLSDTTPEDIQKQMRQRYENRIHRLAQVEPSDAFSAFMHAYTHEYDPHTDYLSPRRYKNFNIDMNLQLQGIGAELRMKNGYAELVRLIPGGPAAKSHKLQPADRVLAVGQDKSGDFTDVVGMRLDHTVQLIRGRAGTTVRLRVSSPDSSRVRTIALERAKIKLKDQAASQSVMQIDGAAGEKPVGLVTLPSFYNGTAADVKQALAKLKKQDVRGVVLDLRNNGGGALGEAMKLIGLFMQPAPGLQIQDASNRVQVLGDRSRGAFYEGPLIVLVNRLSASASEIVAAALQDYGRALIVGSRTFGKGTVQTVLPLKKGELKLTEAKFYRVTGDSTQVHGVKPSIELPSAIDPQRIGESALPNALPWDRIAPTRYPHSNAIDAAIPELRAAHEKQAEHHPDYRYLVKRIRLARRESERERVSLNIETRRQRQQRLEQRSLALANRHRRAVGKQPFDSFAAFKDAQDSADGVNEINTARQDADDDSADAYEKEAGRILLDMRRALELGSSGGGRAV